MSEQAVAASKAVSPAKVLYNGMESLSLETPLESVIPVTVSQSHSLVPSATTAEAPSPSELSFSSITKTPGQLDALTANNLGQLEMIFKYVLPEFKLNQEENKKWLKYQSKLVYFNDICCGGIVARQASDVVTVLAIAVLKPYQALGLGRMLLQDLIDSSRSFVPTLLETKAKIIKGLSNQKSFGFFDKLGFTKGLEIEHDSFEFSLNL